MISKTIQATTDERDERHRKLMPLWAANLVAGGAAGMAEALACHPLDTTKVRMQLSKRNGRTQHNFLKTAAAIVRHESPLGLYRGLGVVIAGITPKIAIRFSSFEAYKQLLTDKRTGVSSGASVFVAGLVVGVTEAVLVVTPMEVIKIRLQASSTQPRVHRGGLAIFFDIMRSDGVSGLYRGVTLTAFRQGTNQACSFCIYTYLKDAVRRWQPQYESLNTNLPSWQTSFIGLMAGSMGPMFNQPIDTIKTRLQTMSFSSTSSSWTRIVTTASELARNEGLAGFYKGIVPRLMKVAPSQAITFTTYEYFGKKLREL